MISHNTSDKMAHIFLPTAEIEEFVLESKETRKRIDSGPKPTRWANLAMHETVMEETLRRCADHMTPYASGLFRNELSKLRAQKRNSAGMLRR